MKWLRHFLDRIEPRFKDGGKFQKLYPLYEAGDTFCYTPGEVAQGASHVRDALDLKRMMTTVIVALLPCIFMAFWNTGYQANLAMADLHIASAPGWRGAIIDGLGIGYSSSNHFANVVHGGLYFLPVYLVTMIAGGFWEVLFSCVRKHEINEGFLVTGMLFPLTLPPTIPLWQVAVGISFGVVIGKEVFGGTGKNFLNPALTARAFLYFAYPAEITGDLVWTAIDSHVDGFSAATPLTALATTDVATGMKIVTDTLSLSWLDTFLGATPGSMGETSTLACLFGALVLIGTGIGSWRIMVGVLIGAVGLSTLLHGMGSNTNPVFAMPFFWHLTVGGLAFGTVFMATDPVSAAMTHTGKWFYGILIGLMSILIRVLNPAYPEGVMLAILFGNVFAPLIDYFVVQANIKRRKARNAA